MNIPAGSLELKTADHLALAVDAAFPNSQPRIFAPRRGQRLHLAARRAGQASAARVSSRNSAPIADRVQTHLRDAEELNFPEPKRREEFEREFTAYWSHRATNSADQARVCGARYPGGGVTREVAYFSMQSPIATSSPMTRTRSSAGFATRALTLATSRSTRPGCSAFAAVDATRVSGNRRRNHQVAPARHRPKMPGAWAAVAVPFEVDTKTGTARGSGAAQGAERRDVMKGFRHMSKVPAAHIVGSYAKRPVERRTCRRGMGSRS